MERKRNANKSSRNLDLPLSNVFILIIRWALVFLPFSTITDIGYLSGAPVCSLAIISLSHQCGSNRFGFRF